MQVKSIAEPGSILQYFRPSLSYYPDQWASSEANRTGSTLFSKKVMNFKKSDVHSALFRSAMVLYKAEMMHTVAVTTCSVQDKAE